MKASPISCPSIIVERILYFFLTILVLGFAKKTDAQSEDEIAIRKILAEQTAAWNNGSLKDYMSGYWQSDSLMFIGKNGVMYGYNATLESYKKSYPDVTARGKLYFDILNVKRLSKRYCYVTGRWQLTRTIGNMKGYFTLLFQKVKNNWVIIADHSG